MMALTAAIEKVINSIFRDRASGRGYQKSIRRSRIDYGCYGSSEYPSRKTIHELIHNIRQTLTKKLDAERGFNGGGALGISPREREKKEINLLKNYPGK